MAQQSDINKIIQQMENANSGDRIRSLCLFYDSNVHSRVTENLIPCLQNVTALQRETMIGHLKIISIFIIELRGYAYP